MITSILLFILYVLAGIVAFIVILGLIAFAYMAVMYALEQMSDD